MFKNLWEKSSNNVKHYSFGRWQTSPSIALSNSHNRTVNNSVYRDPTILVSDRQGCYVINEVFTRNNLNAGFFITAFNNEIVLTYGDARLNNLASSRLYTITVNLNKVRYSKCFNFSKSHKRASNNWVYSSSKLSFANFNSNNIAS